MYNQEEVVNKEIWRKLIHITSIWIPLLYFYIDKLQMVILMSCVCAIYVGMDYYRHKNPFVKKIFEHFKLVIRDFEQEKGAFTGASYLLIASLIVIALFAKMTAIIALSVLVISDSAAAIIGKIYGKTKIFDKTLEGAAAFFISGIIVGYMVIFAFKAAFHFYIIHIMVMMVTTFVELVSNIFKVDDNFSIPISAAISMFLFNIII